MAQSKPATMLVTRLATRLATGGPQVVEAMVAEGVAAAAVLAVVMEGLSRPVARCPAGALLPRRK